MFVDQETIEQEQLRKAVLASTINWKVVERFKAKFGYESADEMVFDWSLDPELLYTEVSSVNLTHSTSMYE